MDQHLDIWTGEGVKGGLIPFTAASQGWGWCSPGRDRPIAVGYCGYPVIMLRPIKGLEFVEEAVTALGYSTELAHHLFRECWAILRPRLPRGSKGIHWRPQSQRRPKPRAPALLSSH